MGHLPLNLPPKLCDPSDLLWTQGPSLGYLRAHSGSLGIGPNLGPPSWKLGIYVLTFHVTSLQVRLFEINDCCQSQK